MVRDLGEVFLLALGLYLLATTTVTAVHVVGSSMAPTLSTGDLLIASKVDYRLHSPERGDIVILKDPLDPSRDFIKRVIGLPYERILIRDHQVLVNGVALDEPYLRAPWLITANWPSQPDSVGGEQVPPNSYFVMGDNRDHSSDSRLFGYINRDQLDGKAILRFYPFTRAQVLVVKPTLAKEP